MYRGKLKIKNENIKSIMETILNELAKFQYKFGGIQIKEIWGQNEFPHYGKKWDDVKHNLLEFFSSLDKENKVIFLNYLENKM